MAPAQLQSFTDGDSNTTNIPSYYRGIPTEIDYPDGGQQFLTVDDLSQITSITDQNGNVTQYSYNPIGRISQITYPTNDSVTWYPKDVSRIRSSTAPSAVLRPGIGTVRRRPAAPSRRRISMPTCVRC